MELSFMSLDSRSTSLASKGKGLSGTDLKKFNNHHPHHHPEPTTCFSRPRKSKISVAVAEININGGSHNSNQKKKPQQQQKHVLLSDQVRACGSRDANATPATDDSIFNFDNGAHGILPPVTENESETAFHLQRMNVSRRLCPSTVTATRFMYINSSFRSTEPYEEFEGKENEKKKTDLSSVVNTINGIPGGGTRAGLFRTPISGGVQSATSAHGLPHPALAVRNLMEQARYAHLCTVMSRMHQRRRGYPFGSLVDFAPDSMGHPIFSLSPLAIHTRNLLADPRCSLVVQIPGWSGLSNARVTIFGDIRPLPDNQQGWAHAHYTAKHPQCASQQWGNFHYYRMEAISDVYFIGGFGTVAWVDVQEYENMQPDKIAVNGVEQNLKELNAIFSKPLKTLLSTETEVDDVSLISIDSRGTDIRVRQGVQFNVQRLSFESGSAVETLDEAKIALQNLIDKFRKISRTT